MWEGMCFRRILYDCRDGVITEEARVRQTLAHIYTGARHHAEGPSADYADVQIAALAIQDMIGAAVAICMRDDEYRVPLGLQERLIEEIMGIKHLSLDDLRRMDQLGDGAGILDDPRLYQILVAAAFQAGNRHLVREMVHAAPPPPGVSVLFAGVPSARAVFGGKSGFGHGALAGQQDNGCDLFVDLIKAGWAVPHEKMQSWPIYSPSIESSKALMEAILQHGVEMGESPAWCAIGENLEMLEFVLQIRAPTDEEEQFHLLLNAARWTHPSERLKYLDTLWKYGVRALNWRYSGSSSHVMSPDDIVWDRTALHVAVQNDDAEMVEWLIRRGAKCFRDKWEKNPFEYAKERGNKDVMAIFERNPGCQKHDYPEYRCGMPVRR